MYSWEKSLRKNRVQQETTNPSFSSTLLDEIYRSIDEGDRKQDKLKPQKDTMKKKQSNGGLKSNRAIEEEEIASFRRACLIEKWIDKKVNEKVVSRRPQVLPEYDRKSQLENDPLFFSSSSTSSSDSSFGGFSSSETESIYGSKIKSSSCFAPPRPKPIRTTVSQKSSVTEKTGGALFYKQKKELHIVDDYHHHNSVTTEHEESLIKAKSRALKIYNNLKKMKQPISPGGRLSTFINSFFTTGNGKKTTKNSTTIGGNDEMGIMERTPKSTTQASTCSSASSFSRSCLSKNSPSTREKLRNGVKRSVRFCPVSVIVDEDCRPCGQKSLYEEDPRSMPLPNSRKSMNSTTTKKEEELKFQGIGKSRRAEEAARDILRSYHEKNKKNNDQILGNIHDDDDDDEDAASDSSSDLFELDHLQFVGKNERYFEELPVYETTHFSTNRAIANGLIL